MADTKISALPAATTPLDGTEVLPVVQSGTTKKVANNDLRPKQIQSNATSGVMQIAGPTAATTRVMTIPDANFTVARTDTAQSFTGLQTFNSNLLSSVLYTTSQAASAATYGGNLYIYSSVGLNAAVGGIEWQYATAGSGYGFKINVNGGTDSMDFGYRANSATFTKAMGIGNNGIITMSAYGAGTATFSASGVISSISDETLKVKDGAPTNPDEMIKNLRPGYWFYDTEKTGEKQGPRQLGFYAQNVHAAIGPEAAPEPEEIVDVSEDGTVTRTGVFRPWGYYDRSVLAVVVMSLQNALAKIELLEAKVTALENK